MVSTTIPKIQALGWSLLSAYSWLSMALDLAQMVLDVRKNLKPTQFYLLNNLYLNNFFSPVNKTSLKNHFSGNNSAPQVAAVLCRVEFFGKVV